MKKILLTTALLSSALLASSLKVGVLGVAMDYREYSKTTDQILDSETTSLSDLKGMELKFDSEINDYLSYEIYGSYISGNSQYIGSLLNSNAGYGSYVGSTANSIIDTGAILKNYNKIDDATIYIGAGIGYKYWKRELSAAQVEDYSWMYGLINLGVEYKAFEKVTIGLDLKYAYAYEPQMIATGISGTFKLGGVNTYSFGIPITYKFSKSYEFYIDNVFETQKITESNVVQGFYEPRSTTQNHYLKVGVKYNF
ncbi:MAG: hypothetical protein GQ570_05840 [Helicobacteraceae bacterium]|nr:hypothetical protein [Helicobacteraceae bacterium]